MEPVDALLHPVRARVVDLLDARPGTIAEIGLRLEASLGRQVPTTSLYRHMRILMDSGLVTVVETRPTDGAPSAVYGIDHDVSNLRPDSVDHVKMMELVAMIQTGTRRRFAWHAARLGTTLPTHRMALFNRTLHLTDDQVREFRAMVARFAIENTVEAPPSGTAPQYFSFFTCPDPDGASAGSDRDSEESSDD